MAAEVFVVDNCSTDGSREYFTNKFTDVHFIWNQENIGFAKANNLILKEVKGDHILFLNPDTIVPEDALEKCLQFFAHKPNSGACGVRMIDGGGKFLPESKRSFPGLFSSLLKLSGSKKSAYYDGNIAETSRDKTEVLSGAFMMITKAAMHSVKGFDDDFFMYGEDIDMSYRLHKNGFQNYYLGDITIVHFKGESTNKFSEKYFTDFYGAMQLFVTKHYNAVSSFFINQFVTAAKKWAVLSFKKTVIIQKNEVTVPTRFFIICNEHSQEKIKALVLNLHSESTCIFITPGLPATELENIIAESSAKENQFLSLLVFCLPNISYTNAILMAEKYGEKIYCLFHHLNSKSVAGSNNKNEKGFFIY